MGKTLLNVEDLVVAFSMYRGDSLKKENLEVIHSLSLDVKEGEILAVVGQADQERAFWQALSSIFFLRTRL
jgi:peptide/nickel transport system ATP-binding protein